MATMWQLGSCPPGRLLARGLSVPSLSGSGLGTRGGCAGPDLRGPRERGLLALVGGVNMTWGAQRRGGGRTGLLGCGGGGLLVSVEVSGLVGSPSRDGWWGSARGQSPRRRLPARLRRYGDRMSLVLVLSWEQHDRQHRLGTAPLISTERRYVLAASDQPPLLWCHRCRRYVTPREEESGLSSTGLTAQPAPFNNADIHGQRVARAVLPVERACAGRGDRRVESGPRPAPPTSSGGRRLAGCNDTATVGDAASSAAQRVLDVPSPGGRGYGAGTSARGRSRPVSP